MNKTKKKRSKPKAAWDRTRAPSAKMHASGIAAQEGFTADSGIGAQGSTRQKHEAADISAARAAGYRAGVQGKSNYKHAYVDREQRNAWHLGYGRGEAYAGGRKDALNGKSSSKPPHYPSGDERMHEWLVGYNDVLHERREAPRASGIAAQKGCTVDSGIGAPGSTRQKHEAGDLAAARAAGYRAGVASQDISRNVPSSRYMSDPEKEAFAAGRLEGEAYAQGCRDARAGKSSSEAPPYPTGDTRTQEWFKGHTDEFVRVRAEYPAIQRRAALEKAYREGEGVAAANVGSLCPYLSETHASERYVWHAGFQGIPFLQALEFAVELDKLKHERLEAVIAACASNGQTLHEQAFGTAQVTWKDPDATYVHKSGFAAGQSREPRKVPPLFSRYKDFWFAGYDSAALKAPNMPAPPAVARCIPDGGRLRCPSCTGSTAQIVQRKQTGGWVVTCRACQLQGPEKLTEAEAVAAFLALGPTLEPISITGQGGAFSIDGVGAQEPPHLARARAERGKGNVLDAWATHRNSCSRCTLAVEGQGLSRPHLCPTGTEIYDAAFAGPHSIPWSAGVKAAEAKAPRECPYPEKEHIDVYSWFAGYDSVARGEQELNALTAWERHRTACNQCWDVSRERSGRHELACPDGQTLYNAAFKVPLAEASARSQRAALEKAFRDGKAQPPTACPYKEEPEQMAWHEGYNDGRFTDVLAFADGVRTARADEPRPLPEAHTRAWWNGYDRVKPPAPSKKASTVDICAFCGDGREVLAARKMKLVAGVKANICGACAALCVDLCTEKPADPNAYEKARLAEDIAHDVDQAMRAKGMLVADVARACKVTPNYIHKILRGGALELTPQELVDIGLALGVRWHVDLAQEWLK